MALTCVANVPDWIERGVYPTPSSAGTPRARALCSSGFARKEVIFCCRPAADILRATAKAASFAAVSLFKSAPIRSKLDRMPATIARLSSRPASRPATRATSTCAWRSRSMSSARAIWFALRFGIVGRSPSCCTTGRNSSNNPTGALRERGARTPSSTSMLDVPAASLEGPGGHLPDLRWHGSFSFGCKHAGHLSASATLRPMHVVDLRPRLLGGSAPADSPAGSSAAPHPAGLRHASVSAIASITMHFGRFRESQPKKGRLQSTTPENYSKRTIRRG